MRRAVIAFLCLGTTLAFAAPPGIAPGSVSPARELELLISDNPRKALEDAEGWLAEARGKKDRELELKALRLQAMATDQMEDSSRLLEVAKRGQALARELQHPDAESEFIAARAAARLLEGRYVEAAKDFDDAFQLAATYRFEGNQARIRIGRGHLFLAIGRIPEALDAVTRAYAHYEKQGDRFGMSTALSTLATLYGRETATRADLEKAVEHHQRALELSQPEGGRFDRSTDFFNLGTAYLRLKKHEQARTHLEKSLALSIELKDEVGAAYAYHRLGTLEHELGRPKEGLELQDKALLVFGRTGDRAMEFRTQLARAEALAALGRKREGLEALERATGIAARLKSPRLEPMLHEAAAAIHARFGDYEQAFASVTALRNAEKRRDEAARSERSAELQARFELQQKEAENALLRAREQESEARRLALVLALVLSLVVLGIVAFFLGGYVRRHQRMANLAAKDDLTGIANRRSILEHGRLHVRRGRKGGEGVCVALIDLDHFKSINDELGHAIGDNVLVAFANASSRQLRSQDRFGRFGGEEFLLVMPGADLAQVPYVFERLRRALNETPIAGLPEGRAITFSLGAAELRGVADDLESIIQRADRALYRAKQAGRDRFETG
jgi:diguanylate cyclase (GGDEF)-like protein